MEFVFAIIYLRWRIMTFLMWSCNLTLKKIYIISKLRASLSSSRHATLSPQCSSTSFSPKTGAIFYKSQSLPRVDPPPPRSLSHATPWWNGPYRILLWVWLVIRGLVGRCFTVGDRCPSRFPHPPNVNTDTHGSSSSGSKEKPSASNNQTSQAQIKKQIKKYKPLRNISG